MFKKCIFHVPNYVDGTGLSGSSVRPYKMIEAFRQHGYQVDVIMGYGKDRKKQIKEIKSKIISGVKYDFLYSESSTMPTLLTEKDHFPRYPFLDFGFFKFCKRNNIKVGLFYRDIYWKFSLYKEQVPFWKRIFSFLFYKYDLIQYKYLLDVIFLPSHEMKKYLPELPETMLVKPLPPGTVENHLTSKQPDREKINLLYVGGISKDVYDLSNLLLAIKNLLNVHLTICCREKDWKSERINYEKYFTDRIHVVHTSGTGLTHYYEEADACCLITNISEYRAFAMPIKLFEYLSFEKPILITGGSVGADFVNTNKIGFVIDDNVQSIKEKLDYILKNPQILNSIKINAKDTCLKNTWYMRATTVIHDLNKGV